MRAIPYRADATDACSDTTRYTRGAEAIERADEERRRQLDALVGREGGSRAYVQDDEAGPPCPDSCEAVRVARGMCMRHYKQWRRGRHARSETAARGAALDAQLLALVESGMTAREAGAVVGLTKAAVTARLFKWRQKQRRGDA